MWNEGISCWSCVVLSLLPSLLGSLKAGVHDTRLAWEGGCDGNYIFITGLANHLMRSTCLV